MILYVKLSERRWLVLDVNTTPSGWEACDYTPGRGFQTVQAERVTPNPVPYGKARTAASRHAASKGTLITHEEWEKRKAG